MKLSSLLRLFLLCAALPSAAIAQEYSIGGSLVSSLDGAIVSHGHLSASLVNADGHVVGSASNIEADADNHGSFGLSLSGPGIWRLTASSKGFRTMELDEHEGFFTGVVLNKAKPAVEVIFRLVPDASIEGYVVDEAGEAVRTAQVTLLREAVEAPDEPLPSWQTRGSTQTDDLGSYEFASLTPGRYEVMVQARPWYASGAPRGSSATAQDSPLDMAYPLTWYPGVTDAASAGIITIAGGESRQADLRLQPVPSIHVRLAPTGSTDAGRAITVPRISLLVPGSGSSFQTGQPTVGAHGEVDVGGLAPGTYEVSLPGGDNRRSILQIGAGAPRTLDLNTAVPMTEVAVRFDAAEGTAAPAVRFIDTETGRVTLLGGEGAFSGFGRPTGGGGRLRGSINAAGEERSAGVRPGRMRLGGDHTVELAPGRYEVKSGGAQGQYLVGLTAKGAETSGHFVTIHGGTPELTLHLAAGHATLEGVGILHGEVAAGAMVMLVPATLGDPEGSTIVRRDQTNSDGSFTLSDVIPGRYILIAIQDGWHLNWQDASTLRRYLLHGLPVELSPSGRQHETVTVQRP